ncbi:MAG: hypothetical protein V7K14_28585, partial [Nostoc sp.]|uniref:hypothetical protein n=1 Tax=Nostoc sp. TaxID=1180 RepID=UPI002FF975E9
MLNTEKLTVNLATLYLPHSATLRASPLRFGYAQGKPTPIRLRSRQAHSLTHRRRQLHLRSYGSHHCHLTLNKVTLVLKKIQKTLDEGEFYLTQSPSSEGA